MDQSNQITVESSQKLEAINSWQFPEGHRNLAGYGMECTGGAYLCTDGLKCCYYGDKGVCYRPNQCVNTQYELDKL